MVKHMKKIIMTILSIIVLFSPTLANAYSSKIILGGDNIGIHIQMKGVLVIGQYKVNGKYIESIPQIKEGDLITKVDDKEVSTIEELTNTIEKNIKNNEVTLTVLRNNIWIPIKMHLEKENNIYKTGLYVKDSITGIGTLTYIDPESNIYGALGHEVLESSTQSMVEVKTGSIFESNITSITKSRDGIAGEKNASFNPKKIYGNILENTSHGIFGEYQKYLPNQIIEVASNEEVKTGEATIYTVLQGNEKQKFKINILSISKNHDTKNITFEITDPTLLQKTGGIVQGMSGSPIVQNNKIIGAVTHVIVDNPIKGYAIFITTMLENGDKIKVQE